MNLNIHRFSTVCIFFTVFLLLWGCQLTDSPVSPKGKADRDYFGEKGLDPACPKGEGRFYELIRRDPFPVEAHYSYYTEVPPFQLKDCLCQTTSYKITFPTLPGARDILVFDTENNRRSFTITSLVGGEKILEIDSVETLPDKALTVFIQFKGEVPVPEAGTGSGLCVINDLDGDPTGPQLDTLEIHTEPFKITLPPTLFGGDSVKKAFIPEAITW